MVLVLELFKLTIHEARDLLRKREISSRELTESVLKRIKETEDSIHSFISWNSKTALKQADKVDKIIVSSSNPSDLPDLTGIPYGLKDNICVRGMRTTCASKAMKYFNPSHDSTVAHRFKTQNAILVGKLNMDEFAIGSTGETSAFTITRNPWGENRVPGGSSGGSAAAVAGDQILFSLGSDTGGSVRQPASFCGVVGLKPTLGVVSSYGLIPFATSLDQIGPLCKDVTDCAIVMNSMAGFDTKDRVTAKRKHPDYTRFLRDGVSDMKIGLPLRWIKKKMDNDVSRSFEAACSLFEKMGGIIIEIFMPNLEYGVPTYYLISSAEASHNLTQSRGARMGYTAGDFPELDDFIGKTDMQELGAMVKKRILLGNIGLYRDNYEEYYLQALKVRTLIRQDFEKAFKQVDWILTPTTPSTAFHFNQSQDNLLDRYEDDALTIPANLAGLPALSIPCGFDSSGMPIGMQLIGKAFDEGMLIQAAYTFEQNTDYHLKSPLSVI
jgi:aspartyl-tRNA(Asn)/glutamyl-tRNA(Gln) amidotransferase subunit A